MPVKGWEGDFTVTGVSRCLGLRLVEGPPGA
jgi:hypothetical protein